MPNPNTFDEASAATQDLFENEQQSAANLQNEEIPVVADEQSAEASPDEKAANEPQTPVPPSDDIGQAAQTAELAAQVASEKDGQLQQALSEIEALKQQNQQLQGTIDEISSRNAENVIKEALTPPTLDLNSLAFADEETQKSAMAKYAEDMSAYNRSQIMKELSPALEYAKKGMREEEAKEAVSALSQIPELSNINEMLPQLDKIIANNKWLQSDDMPIDEKYINAYAMARGIDTINNPPKPPKEPTTDELMELYNSNPAFRELVEKQRLEEIKQSQQVPSFSASSGAVNAALNIKEKPQTLEEASRRTKEMFGGM